MEKTLRIIIICLSLLNVTWCQSTILFEGDSCTVSYDQQSSGTCLKQSRCPTLKPDIRAGNYPDICSYNVREPVVCCRAEHQEQSFNNRLERISEQKCKEYSTLATKTVDVISLALNPSVNRIPVSECEESVPLIVGGTKAARSEFPHMTAIGWTQWDGSIEWQCGGSIISEYWILSAAHCKVIGRASPDVVRVGTHRLSRPKSGYADFQIIELLTPPEPQNYVASSRYNDILLIRVDRQMRFHKNLRPACLWHEPNIGSNTALVSGWGKQEFSDTEGTDDLFKVSLNIYDNAVCRRQYPPERRTKDGVIGSQLCAGTLAGGKDSCQGDSGGPLQITQANSRCVYHIIGVTSYGRGCGDENTPAIYTRVSSFINWIESVVWR